MSKSYKYDADHSHANEFKKKRRQTRRVNDEFKDCETIHWHHTHALQSHALQKRHKLLK